MSHQRSLTPLICHADYSDRASILVVKRPDMFGFRNPGLMRIPASIAVQGGESDCRNRTLHKMFRLVGVGEQAGSGVPKIYRGWATQHWRAPALYERVEPYEQTLLELWMFDLLPASVVADLRRMFGRRFDDLHRNERLAVVTAATERVVTHARVREMTALHPFDITRMLQNLVRDKFLEPHNSGRGAVYCLPGVAIPTPEEVFRASSAHSGEGSAHLIARSAHLPISSAQFGASSAQLSKQPSRESETRDPEGRLLTEQLDAPVIDSLDALEPEFRAQLGQIKGVRLL